MLHTQIWYIVIGMEGIRVCLVGNTLFADNVAQMLRGCEVVSQVDHFPSVPEAMHYIDSQPPNVLVLADVDATILVGDTPFLPICPDIPVICTDYQSNLLKLINTTHVSARLPDLINAVTTLKAAQAQR